MSRKRLPDRRPAWIQKCKLLGPNGWQTFYLTCGEYPDGKIGEIFLDAHKEGTFSRGVLSALARVVSIALQHGVPPEEIVKTLRWMNFPPSGEVISELSPVKNCLSVVDWIAQEIELAYVLQAPITKTPADTPEPTPLDTPPDAEDMFTKREAEKLFGPTDHGSVRMTQETEAKILSGYVPDNQDIPLTPPEQAAKDAGNVPVTGQNTWGKEAKEVVKLGEEVAEQGKADLEKLMGNPSHFDGSTPFLSKDINWIKESIPGMDKDKE
jgi:hypothetical protein